jgi:signal transduction histidine kinase
MNKNFRLTPTSVRFLLLTTLTFLLMSLILVYAIKSGFETDNEIFYTVILEAAVMWVVLMFVLAKIIYQKPINDLRTAAKNLNEGNFKTNIKIGSNDELTELGSVFNEIALKLKTAQESLGDKIKEKALVIEEEKKLDQVKSDFINIASEQLQSSLSSLHRLVDSLRASMISNDITDQQKDNIREIDLATRRLAKLADDMMSVSRIQSRLLKTEKDLIDIVKFSENFVQSMESYATASKHVIVLIRDEDLPRIKVDTQIIYTILQNLVTNAVDYSPAETAINLIIKKDNNSVRFSVSNKGKLIPKEEQERLFTKFYRAEFNKDMKEDGTGLGLFIVKSLVTSAGGTVGFKSEGEETTFYFTIPIN